MRLNHSRRRPRARLIIAVAIPSNIKQLFALIPHVPQPRLPLATIIPTTITIPVISDIIGDGRVNVGIGGSVGG